MNKQTWSKKLVLSVGAMALLTTVAPTGSMLPSVGTVEVQAAAVTYTTTENLNLRSGASTKHKVLVNIPKGKTVTYVSKSGTWSKVKYGSKTGFVSTKYLKKVEAKAPVKAPATPKASAPAPVTYTTTDNLNMRSGASTKHKVLVNIPKGKTVTYVSKSGTWFKVKYGTKTGYVSSAYLKKVAVKAPVAPKAPVTKYETVYTTTESLNLRAGTSLTQKVLLTIPKGKTVKFLKKSGTWSQVTYGGKTGYVSTKYLKTTQVVVKPAPAPLKETAFATKKFVTTGALTVRASFSSTAKTVINVPKGITISSNAKAGEWFKVTYGGKSGWVLGSFLKEVVEVKPAPKPVTPAKDSFIPILKAENHLKSLVSPQDRYSKLYSKPTTTLFTATLLPSTSEEYSARYGVTYIWKDSERYSRLKVNSQRFRDNKHLQENGKAAIQYATEAMFGRGNKGTKELQDFIYKHMDGKSDFDKTMSFGGNEARVNVGEWDIDITFK